jgi:hypothetical protein
LGWGVGGGIFEISINIWAVSFGIIKGRFHEYTLEKVEILSREYL